MDVKGLLQAVKDAKNITGNFQDKALEAHISEVLEYMADAGVSDHVLQSDSIVGTVVRGVSDLWENGGVLSDYFKQRVCQLSYK